MTFTYDENDPFGTDRDQIRSKVQDTIEGKGVKPGKLNFSDEFIAGLLAIEGSVNRTVAAVYEALETAWANHIDTELGPRDEKLSQIAKRYEILAKRQRDEYGYAEGKSVISVGSFDEGISEDNPF